MREKTLERKLTEAVKAMGGIAPKFISPGFDGMPDRLVLLPDGKCGFVEVKRQGEKPRPLQESRHGMLRRLGFRVFVLDGLEQIPQILKEIRGDFLY
ncbi:VRR-NUC domain-containing protein [Dehalococcoides mccartyi]|uniref:VRR-NUC domain-containing protein n=1 Tax=Dehalococcoides mccartyi TaxID=61435 RepID=A0AB38Z916_9CHLR|nr:MULTISPECIES: VRR-NUC domain-containing protein [Dehalococcoides]WRO07076.1 VRR-NUC domain-containing protein [Dehalococcoides mccartyi]